MRSIGSKFAVLAVSSALTMATPAHAQRRCSSSHWGTVLTREGAAPGRFVGYFSTARSPERSAIRPSAALFETWLAPTIVIRRMGAVDAAGNLSGEKPVKIEFGLGQMVKLPPQPLTLQVKSGALDLAVPLSTYLLQGRNVEGGIIEAGGYQGEDPVMVVPAAQLARIAAQLEGAAATMTLRSAGKVVASVVVPPIGGNNRAAQLAWMRQAAAQMAQGKCAY